jgi:hypothetical protein
VAADVDLAVEDCDRLGVPVRATLPGHGPYGQVERGEVAAVAGAGDVQAARVKRHINTE